MRNKDILYYLIAFGVFVLMKFGFTMADNRGMLFLLKPTNKLIGFLMGSTSVYLEGEGYYHSNLNIYIGKSCSGFNFWCLSFLTFTYLVVKVFNKPIHKILSIPLVLMVTYLLTVFVNTSRIYASILIQNQTKNIFLNQQDIIHESIGIVTNLTFLILFYILIEKLTKNKHCYEKLT